MNYILLFAVVLVLALFGGRVASFFSVPRVTGYLLTGLAIGPSAAGILTRQQVAHFSFVSDVALGIIAFYIGTEFESAKFRKLKRTLPVFFLADVAVTSVLVFVLLFAVARVSVGAAALLGILSVATAPAATLLVIREYDSEGPLTDHIMAMVGLNNLACILLFVVAVTVVTLSPQDGGSIATVIAGAGLIARELALPVVLGMGVALFLNYYLRRRLDQNELLVVCLSAVLLGVGASFLFSVSALLTNLAAGAFLANTCDRSKAVVRRLSEVDYPLYALFFAFAGASFHLEMVEGMGLAGVIYILGRAGGKIAAALAGGRLARAGVPRGLHLGAALLPQAGLAIGLSSWAAGEIPGFGASLLSLILATTVVFEVVGPVMTRLSLTRGGEVKVIKMVSAGSLEHLKADLYTLLDRLRQALGSSPGRRGPNLDGPIRVKHLMRYHIESIFQDATLDNIVKTLRDSRYSALPVIGRDNTWVGMLSLDSIKDISLDADLARLIIAGDVAERVETVTPEDPLEHAARVSESSGLPYLPVVEGEDVKRFVGVIHRRDMSLFQLEAGLGEAPCGRCAPEEPGGSCG